MSQQPWGPHVAARRGSTAAATAPNGVTQNILVLMQQLQESQMALRRSEARCDVVEDENRRLRAELDKRTQQHSASSSEPTGGKTLSRGASLLVAQVVTGPDDDALGTPPHSAGKGIHASASTGGHGTRGATHSADLTTSLFNQELESKDKLISELQRQLTDVLRRNTSLEVDVQARHTALRQQFEAHVDRLELEIRRGKAMQASSPPSAYMRSFPSGGGGGSGSSSFMASPLQSQRKDLL